MIDISYDPQKLKGNPSDLSGIVMVVSPESIHQQIDRYSPHPRKYIHTFASEDPDKLVEIVNHTMDQKVSATNYLEATNFYTISYSTQELLEPLLPEGIQVDIYELGFIAIRNEKIPSIHDFIALSYVNDFRQRQKEKEDSQDKHHGFLKTLIEDLKIFVLDIIIKGVVNKK